MVEGLVDIRLSSVVEKREVLKGPKGSGTSLERAVVSL